MKKLIISKKLVNLVGQMAKHHAQSVGANSAKFYKNYYLDIQSHLSALFPIGQGLGFTKNDKIIEIGSGIGTRCLLGKLLWGANFTGVEPGANMYSPIYKCIREFRISNPSIHYHRVRKNGERTGLPSNCFDYVLSFETLEHVSNPSAVIKEMFQLLKKGGKAYITTSNYQSFYEGHFRCFWLPFFDKCMGKLWVKFLGYNPGFIDEINFITKKLLRKYLKEAGFKTVEFGKIFPSDTLPELEMKFVSHYKENFRNRPKFWQKFVQQPSVTTVLSFFDLEYKLYVLCEK